jgi:hypothetical protein
LNFSIDEQQAKATAKDVAYPSRDVNLAPITEDEELPSGNPNDDEEVKQFNSIEIPLFFLSLQRMMKIEMKTTKKKKKEMMMKTNVLELFVVVVRVLAVVV